MKPNVFRSLPHFVLTTLLLVPALGIATSVTISGTPMAFQADTVISSAEVNGNFTQISTNLASVASAVNDNDARLTALEGNNFATTANLAAYVPISRTVTVPLDLLSFRPARSEWNSGSGGYDNDVPWEFELNRRLRRTAASFSTKLSALLPVPVGAVLETIYFRVNGGNLSGCAPTMEIIQFTGSSPTPKSCGVVRSAGSSLSVAPGAYPAAWTTGNSCSTPVGISATAADHVTYMAEISLTDDTGAYCTSTGIIFTYAYVRYTFP